MGSKESRVEIIIYRITGQQGFIDIPHRYCEECDLTIAAVRRVVEDLSEPQVRLRVLPWMLHFWRPILRGGWHAPIVTVNGRVISQGVVPTPDTVRRAITRALSGDDRVVPTTQATKDV